MAAMASSFETPTEPFRPVAEESPTSMPDLPGATVHFFACALCRQNPLSNSTEKCFGFAGVQRYLLEALQFPARVGSLDVIIGDVDLGYRSGL